MRTRTGTRMGGSEGERERGREGERENGREGERQRGREGVGGRKRNSVFVYTVLYSLLLVSHKNYHTDTICVHVHTCVHVSHTNLQTHATSLYICTS